VPSVPHRLGRITHIRYRAIVNADCSPDVIAEASQLQDSVSPSRPARGVGPRLASA
jgi:hypothetical protein